MSKRTKPDGQASAANRPMKESLEFKESPEFKEAVRQALIGAPELSDELCRRLSQLLWPVEYEDSD